jgi:hypothetical protein
VNRTVPDKMLCASWCASGCGSTRKYGNSPSAGRTRAQSKPNVTPELRQADPNAAPVSTCVLAAALVEGALTFVVRHARKTGLAVFRSNDFDGEPRTWKIDELVRSASTGGPQPYLIAKLRIARKFSFEPDSAFTRGECYRNFREGRRTFGRKKRATRKAPPIRSCVAYSTGSKDTPGVIKRRSYPIGPCQVAGA